MIYDVIKNIGNYRGQSLWLDKAIDFLETIDLELLTIGRTEIAGDKVFLNVMEAKAKEEDEVKFEMHKKYMDIQIDIEGTENIAIGIEIEDVIEKYREDIDFGIVECSESVMCKLGKGRFIICMQEEPHKPGIIAGDNPYLKKCVLKVAVD